ncbi:hypothetical protein IWW45_004324 [Coemansia sp. RSA 485]|nr:hypothetical protein IWW45_004324 [Coemansia sp. RSA 485]
MRIDMGNMLPKEPASRRITGDTQFMFQFYKPCIQYYAPSPQISVFMRQTRLQNSLIVALHGCPLLFGNFSIKPDSSIYLEYTPDKPNSPTVEFQNISVTYAEMKSGGFSYSLAKRHQLDMAIPDGAITKTFDKPMLMIKISYLADGGVAIFNMSNHVAFDGNAIFSFIAHWAKCNSRPQSQLITDLPAELESYETSMVTNTSNVPTHGPIEISVDASMTPQELIVKTTKSVNPEDIRACVFEISTEKVSQLKQLVVGSGVLKQDEYVSSNSVLTAFIAQCVAKANTEGQIYDIGNWTVFQSLDMRRPMGLPLGGLGSPIILAEYQAPLNEVMDFGKLPELARNVRKTVDRYSKEYLQNSMDWMNATYRQMASSGMVEPWRHFWFTALNTNRRAVGVSCMNRIPVYEADFGAGRPSMARSFNPRPNYVIVFPGPPSQQESLHLYVTLELSAMQALCADSQWSQRCRLISDF